MKDNDKYVYINYKNPFSIISMISLALSVPFRIAGYKDLLSAPIYLYTQVLLPVLCSVLLIIVILVFGKKKLYLSIIPLTLGVLSFVFKLFIDPRYTGILHHAVCVLLYSAIIVIWALTVLGRIKTKWPVVIIFATPFLFHLFAEDLPVILGFASPLSGSMWLKEMSMLTIMLGLSMCGLAFEKRPPLQYLPDIVP